MRWVAFIVLGASVAHADDAAPQADRPELTLQTPATAAVADADQPVVVERRERSRVYAAWTLAGAGAVAVVGGFAAGFYARDLYHDQFDDDSCTASALPMCDSEGYAATQRARRWANLGTITAGAGLALIATGAIVYATAPRERVVVVPIATLDSAGVGMTARF